MSNLTCPRGCERKGKPIPITTIRGWKKHMSGTHGTWTDEELANAIGQSSGESTTSEEFSRMAESLPETESGLPGADPPSPDGAAGDRVPPTASAPQVSQVKTDAASKKLNAKMAKMKRDVAQQVPKALNSILAGKGPEWNIDAQSQSMITDSIESVFDMLDVQFSIQQFNVELKSRLWVLLYPVGAILMVLASLAIKNAPKENEEAKPNTTRVEQAP